MNISNNSNYIIDGSTAGFQADVIEASLSMPILVDFWAPWCGPCKQLTPIIEKVIGELNGKIKLVKINLDENQQLATQMGVKSVPTVIAFVNGKPVDGFMGALPYSQVLEFAKKTIASAPQGQGDNFSAQLEKALEQANLALEHEKYADAEHIFSTILEHQPNNDDALIGLAKTYVMAKVFDKAQEELDRVSEKGQKSAQFLSLAAKIELFNEAAKLSLSDEHEADKLKAKLENKPDDHQTRYNLALVLNENEHYIEAAEQLIEIMRQDREWNDDGARKKLLEFFTSWGQTSEQTIKARRLLSSLLFS